jgi:hypothetical protein
MKDKRILIIAGLVAVLLIAIPLTVYIANQQQEVRSNAQVPQQTADAGLPTDTPIAATNMPTSTGTPTPSPTVSPTTTAIATPTTAAGGAATPTGIGGTCQAPAAVSGVELSYPSCQGTQCDFTQASCSWAAVNGAVSYSITVTQVETGSVTSTTTVTAPTVTYSFPVTQGQTYRCDITAVNACGASGVAGSAQALCAVDGQVASPQPTQPPQPTVPPQVIPTVVATGDTNMTMLVGIGGVFVAILGGVLFLFSGI